MRHMGNSGKIAIGAMLAALALLVLTAITLNETVGLWFMGAAALAYVACVAEVVIRRRHKTLAASGVGSVLFIAFGIAFLRQWGLAFNPDPDALSTRVDTEHPDLYFYLAAAAGAATLLLLFAGTVVPGKFPGARSLRSAQRRPPAASRGRAKGAAPRAASGRASAGRPTAGGAAGRPPTPRSAPRPAAKAPSSGSGQRPAAASRGGSGAKPGSASPAKSSAISPAKPPARPPARATPRR